MKKNHVCNTCLLIVSAVFTDEIRTGRNAMDNNYLRVTTVMASMRRQTDVKPFTFFIYVT